MVVDLYGVLSHESCEVLDIFATETEAAAVVVAWDQDEPDQAGALEVVALALDVSPN